MATVYPIPADTLADEAERILAGLPPTAIEIAAFLESVGVRGVRDSLCACPIARWLRAELEVPYVTVDHSGIVIWDHIGNMYNMVVPTGVHAFVDCFDADMMFEQLVDAKGVTAEEEWGMA